MISLALHNPPMLAEAACPVSGCAIDTLEDSEEWDEMLRQSRRASVFHSSAWAETLREAYGHKPHYLRVRLAAREIGLVPVIEVPSRLTGRRAVSVPFADRCGPLGVREGDEGPLCAALAEYAGIHRWRYLEVRGGCHAPDASKPEARYQIHSLELTAHEERLWGHLTPSARRAVRKAVKGGLRVAFGTSPEFLHDYYHLHQLTRRRHGLPPQPRRFFSALHRHLIARGLGAIFLAHDRGKPLAGAVFLKWGGSAIYKFGASDPAALLKRPNHLVMWSAMRFLAGEGCTTLSLGRSAVDNHGLARFKESWGARREPLAYFRYRPGAGWNGRDRQPSETPRRAFAACPLPLSRLAGACIYPHLD